MPAHQRQLGRSVDPRFVASATSVVMRPPVELCQELLAVGVMPGAQPDFLQGARAPMCRAVQHIEDPKGSWAVRQVELPGSAH